MTAHALNPCLERVVRAEEHLIDLRQRLTFVFQQQENAIVAQFARGSVRPTLIPPSETFVTMRIGVLIGEICYNLRSALDYLIFALAEHDSGTKQQGTQFPIVDTIKDFRWRTKTWLKGINLAHIAEIETLQPYCGCNATKILRDLSNRDKHREFADIKGDFVAYGYIPGDPEFIRLPGPARRTPHPIHGEMDVKINFTARITFADETPIVETLEVVKLFVAETLEAFKSVF
ncbi:MAG TPA: hypothetical protein VGK96_20075 [Candidatus Sulfotelmatobacter sp.]|jgi:hypothetical protein